MEEGGEQVVVRKYSTQAFLAQPKGSPAWPTSILKALLTTEDLGLATQDSFLMNGGREQKV